MDKNHIIKVLTTSLENKRKAGPEIARLQKAYEEVSTEKEKALVRVSESFDNDLVEIINAIRKISHEQDIPLSVGLYSDKERFLPDALHDVLSDYDYKLNLIMKRNPDFTLSDEAIITLFENEFGDIVQYWSPSNVCW